MKLLSLFQPLFLCFCSCFSGVQCVFVCARVCPPAPYSWMLRSAMPITGVTEATLHLKS